MLGRYVAIRILLAWPFVGLAACGSQPAELQVVAGTPMAARSGQTPTVVAGPAEIKVYVTGAVVRPGVYTLPFDSRIEDAVDAAGGFVDGADMVRVNLAARVKDEQEIFVPKVGESAAVAAASTRLNVNMASATQLRDALGISSSLASKIVAYRNKNGPFATVDDLKKVPVPSAQFNRIKDALTTQ